jgi:ABC-2 type transport system permease protein
MVHKALAFVRRDFQTQASYRLAMILHVFGMLISIFIFYFISNVVGPAANSFLQSYGTDYFHFALVGLAFQPFVWLSVSSLSAVVQEYQGTGTLEILFLSPTPILVSLVMSTLWRYCWALLEALFYLLVATLLFKAQLDWGRILVAGLVVLLIILANAGIGLVNAGFVLVTKRASPLVQLLSLLTGLLAGLYYPIEVLPGWLQALGRALPATYSFEALRRAMLQGATLSQIAPDLLALVGFSLVLLPIGLISFRYAVRWAKIDGSLAQY